MGSTKNGGFDRDMAIFIKQKGWDFGVLSFETNSHRFLHCETSLVFKDEKTFPAMIGVGMGWHVAWFEKLAICWRSWMFNQPSTEDFPPEKKSWVT
jgi:hypothetical protein